MFHVSILVLTPLLKDIAALTEDQGAYGSFGGAGYLVVNRTTRATASEYSRWLDMDRAVAVSKWKEGGVWVSRYANLVAIPDSVLIAATNIVNPCALIRLPPARTAPSCPLPLSTKRTHSEISRASLSGH